MKKLTALLITMTLNITPALAQADLAQLPAKMDQLVTAGTIPGSITYIIEEGKTVFHYVNGYQDIASKTAMTEDSIFRWYSMSKPITSVAIMMLHEQGKLNIADPVAKYLPGFSEVQVYQSGELDAMITEPPRRPMTIADLLTHEAGLTYHFTGTSVVHQYYRKYGVKRDTPVGTLPTDGAPAKNLQQLSERLAKAPLLHHPGERFSYSYSTTLLGHVIEVVSGQRLDTFLQNTLFAPLGMRNTGFFVTGEALDHFATNYVMTADGLRVIETNENTDYKDPNRLLDGGGALAGTARDYLAFVTMLLNGGSYNNQHFLRTETLALMYQPHTVINGLGNEHPIGFGYGFAVGDNNTETLHFMPAGTYGWAGSGNTLFWLNPQKKQLVLFMTQVITPPPFDKQVPFREILINATKE